MIKLISILKEHIISLPGFSNDWKSFHNKALIDLRKKTKAPLSVLNLKIGKYNLSGEESGVTMGYEQGEKFLSNITRRNVIGFFDKLGITPSKIYIGIVPTRIAYSYYITGEYNGIPIAIARKETGSSMAGQTYLVSPSIKTKFNLVKELPVPDILDILKLTQPTNEHIISIPPGNDDFTNKGKIKEGIIEMISYMMLESSNSDYNMFSYILNEDYVDASINDTYNVTTNFVIQDMIANNYELTKDGEEILVSHSNEDLITREDIIDYIKENKSLKKYLEKTFWKYYLEKIRQNLPELIDQIDKLLDPHSELNVSLSRFVRYFGSDIEDTIYNNKLDIDSVFTDPNFNDYWRKNLLSSSLTEHIISIPGHSTPPPDLRGIIDRLFDQINGSGFELNEPDSSTLSLEWDDNEDGEISRILQKYPDRVFLWNEDALPFVHDKKGKFEYKLFIDNEEGEIRLYFPYVDDSGTWSTGWFDTRGTYHGDTENFDENGNYIGNPFDHIINLGNQ
jgi:hypothetical protein